MKWLKSTTQKSWVASCKDKQIVIPQCETRDNRWLSLRDEEWAEVSKIPVIASLVKAGGIMVLDEEPAELKNTVPALQVTNTQLRADLDMAQARIIELEAQLKNNTGIDVEAIKAEVRQQCEAEKQKALEELDAKASALIAEKDALLSEKEATITKLEKKLKKAGEE